MVHTVTLASGVLLAQRYELLEIVSERLNASTWRAHDHVLSRNVGIEVVHSADPRADAFVQAARDSTRVSDPRFLRVFDLLLNESDHHVVVREWARGTPLDELVATASLPNRRAAFVVADIAEALAAAHARGIYHRRLMPHQILVKDSGAVRILGLGVTAALDPDLSDVDERPTGDKHEEWEHLDVLAIGRLLYACLVSRWPAGHAGALKPAPKVNGRIPRPRRVRAGVSRPVDQLCDRILELRDVPVHHPAVVLTASNIAAELRMAALEDVEVDETGTGLRIDHDVDRVDPVIEPVGPPPGLEPPRRRPKAHMPKPPTSLDRVKAGLLRATTGDRVLIIIGVAVVLTLAGVIGILAGTTQQDGDRRTRGSDAAVTSLEIVRATDLDPVGNGLENPDQTPLAIDGDRTTAWTTSTYFNRPDLGGLKPGVGLVLDLGSARFVDSVRIQFVSAGTDLVVYTARPGTDRPTSLDGLNRRARIRDSAQDASVQFEQPTLTRYVVVWLTKLPEVGTDRYQGAIAQVTVRGSD